LIAISTTGTVFAKENGQTSEMVELATLIERTGSPGSRLLERAIFDTNSAEVVAAEIASFMSDQLDTAIEALFYSASVGIVVGLRLTDGVEVVVKVHRWNVSVERLQDVQRVQAHLSDLGMPVPRPIVGPKPLGSGIAVIEEMRRGDLADGHQPEVRKSLAEGLYKLVESSKPLIDYVDLGVPLVLLDCGEDLWPEPHDARFDFEGTSVGAKWIDDLGREARRRLFEVPGQTVIGHFDWRVQNLGFSRGVISAIYDWDSLGRAPEPVVVGCAAAQFSAVWGDHVTSPLPILDEMKSFVELYESARGQTFTPGEREMLDAANLWTCAYGARCQHSDAVLSKRDATKTIYGRLLRERGVRALA
jgi:hypothetical protein